MAKGNLLVDNECIVNAFLIVLYRNQIQDKRQLRLLEETDFNKIHQLRSYLRRNWYGTPADKRGAYHTWRKEILDTLAKDESWTQASRNLYSSLLSTIGGWVRSGAIDQEAQQLLVKIRPGADLLLPFIVKPYQLRMKGI